MAPYGREQVTLEPPVPSHPGRPLRPCKGWELAGPVVVKGRGLVGPVPVATFYPQGPLGPAAPPEETLLGALLDLIPARLAEETGGLGRAGLELVAWLASRLVRDPRVSSVWCRAARVIAGTSVDTLPDTQAESLREIFGGKGCPNP